MAFILQEFVDLEKKLINLEYEIIDRDFKNKIPSLF